MCPKIKLVSESYTAKVNCSLIVIKHCQLCTPETSNVVIIACSFSKCQP